VRRLFCRQLAGSSSIVGTEAILAGVASKAAEGSGSPVPVATWGGSADGIGIALSGPVFSLGASPGADMVNCT
jgi:hypothetical protein